MRSFAATGLIIFIVVLLITGNIFLSIGAYIISKIFFGNGNAFISREQAQKIDQLQLDGFAVLLAYLLKETGHTNSQEGRRALEFFERIFEDTFPGTNPEYGRKILSDLNYANINAQQAAQNLNSTFVHTSAARFSAASLLTCLVVGYTHIVSPNVDARFIKVCQQIGQSLGLNNIVVMITILKNCNLDANAYESAGFQGFGFGGAYGGQGGYQGGRQGGGYDYRQGTRNEFTKACELLGVTEDVTKEELKKVRRRLQNKWHPDKAPEGQREAYSKKAKEINAACDIIEAYKGFQ